jgi:fibronectin type 3 domain-containing protein
MIVNAFGRVAGEQSAIHAFRVQLNRNVSLQYALDRIRRHSDVLYVEPNHVLQAVATPNDPSWGSQYGPKKMQADLAWDYYEPQGQTVVAVVDTGVDYTHPDLTDVLYRDASGTVIGYNAITGTTNAADDQGHGTHCAGTIAARINNGKGVAGVAGWNPLMAGSDNYVKIMPVKVLDSSGNGSDSSVASGVIWAADHGAKVISLSLGGAGSSSTTSNAISYAWNKGCVVVAAAGNSGVSTPFYPAAYSNVISVGATDGSDTLASFSNYGSWVKVAAPGVGIYSSYVGGGYASMSGTSMATPHVAGLAALLRSQSPGLSNSQINTLITGNVDPYVPYSGRTLGAVAGRVNAYRALLAARGTTVPTPTVPAAPTNLQATAGNAQVALTWTASTGAASYTVKRSTSSGTGYATVASGLSGAAYTDSSVTNGTPYYYVVTATNTAGEGAASSQVSATPASSGSTLPAPANLKATVTSYVYLTWNTVSGATSYRVKRSATSGTGYTTIATGLTGANYFDFGASSTSSTYYYVVTAVNAAGESANSAQVSNGSTTTTPTAPATPTGLQATAGNGQVALTWTASSGATGYNVKRSTTSGSGYAAVASGQVTGTSFTDTSVANGTIYYYVVTATNTAGESASSSQVSATPVGSGLAAPTNLKATVTSYVYLTWNAVSGATSYRVKRSNTSGTGFVSIATGLTGPNYFDFGVSKGTTCYYVVTAINATGESANSAQVSTGSTTSAPAAPAAPAGLEATAGNGQVALTWTASTGATGYNVKRSTTSGSGYAAVASGQVTGTSFTDTSVANGTTYYYVVTAINDGGESDGSSQVSATPAAPTGSTLAAPTNLKATVGSYVYLTWNAVSGATTYTVKRSTTSGSGYVTIGSGLTGATHFDFGVNSGTTYYYVVVAVNASGESAPSAELSVAK